MNHISNIPFYLVDVFAQEPLSGNPLAVVTNAAELNDPLMQRIAREFNQSETTFILPPTSQEAIWRLRSFTPAGAEVYGAGHNALGAWWWLAESGKLELSGDLTTFVQEIGEERLPVEVVSDHGDLLEVRMRQAPPAFDRSLTDVQFSEQLPNALGLKPKDFNTDNLFPQVVSTGAAHLLVPVRSRAAVSQVKADASSLSSILSEVGAQGCYVFCLEPIEPDSTAHARLFNPTVGISEDPATGSAAGPLACYLKQHKVISDETPVIIEQGYKMGRPSKINIQVSNEQVQLSGQAVTVAKGELLL